MVPRISEPPVEGPPSHAEELANRPKPSAIAIEQLRPPPQRRSTAPESPTSTPPSSPTTTFTLPSRPRNRSPFTKTHLRSRSTASALSAPQMARAHSSPVPNTTAIRPSSPLGPPARHRSPLRKAADEPFSSFSNQLEIGETISENHELDIPPRAPREDGVPVSPLLSTYNTFPRSRRRPSSPFHPSSGMGSSSSLPSQHSQSYGPTSTPLRTSTSSPSLAPSQFNESYPSSFSYYSSSSIPSTPTSFRSRSPSISSLETIPDSPDAELEAENIARLKAAADQEDARDSEVEDNGGTRRGFGLGRSDKRKRWSVCGAERRGDLDLETIWED
ncbi:MAG: hypothetical protein LQ342_001970 [Letrouitia transgressa]|nr:MAG: hypothetical protein LQ342_001970 [Letrouitia transgressa]